MSLPESSSGPEDQLSPGENKPLEQHADVDPSVEAGSASRPDDHSEKSSSKETFESTEPTEELSSSTSPNEPLDSPLDDYPSLTPKTPSLGFDPDRLGPQPAKVVFVPSSFQSLRPPPWRKKEVIIDFERGTIEKGKQKISFGNLILLEIRHGIFGASDGQQWLQFDASEYRDAQGLQLVSRRGQIRPSFHHVLDRLRQGFRPIQEARGVDFQWQPEFDLRFKVSLDPMMVFFTLISIAIFFGFELIQYQRLPLKDLDGGLGIFLISMVFALSGFIFWRYFSRVKIDEQGIHWRRPFFKKVIPWNEVKTHRHQGLEVEFESSTNKTVTLNLGSLEVTGQPMVIRRGMRPYLTPLGHHFFKWVSSQAPEGEVIPLQMRGGQRWYARMWIFLLVTANVIGFMLSRPEREKVTRIEEFYYLLLREQGSRTENSFEEPLRFFSALFLHRDEVHLAFNMLVLACLAPWIGRIYGWGRATLHYLLGGVLGNVLAHFYFLIETFNPSILNVLGFDLSRFIKGSYVGFPFISIGASTAVLGMIGSLLGAVYRRPERIPLAVRARFRWAIPVVVFLTMAMGMAIQNIDNGAHFGGFLAGMILTMVIPPPKN